MRPAVAAAQPQSARAVAANAISGWVGRPFIRLAQLGAVGAVMFFFVQYRAGCAGHGIWATISTSSWLGECGCSFIDQHGLVLGRGGRAELVWLRSASTPAPEDLRDSGPDRVAAALEFVRGPSDHQRDLLLAVYLLGRGAGLLPLPTLCAQYRAMTADRRVFHLTVLSTILERKRMSNHVPVIASSVTYASIDGRFGASCYQAGAQGYRDQC